MKRLFSSMMAVLLSMALIAQEKSTDVNVNIDKESGGGFWGSPVVWIAGAAIFILLLVALLRGSSRQS